MHTRTEGENTKVRALFFFPLDVKTVGSSRAKQHSRISQSIMQLEAIPYK